MTTTRKVTSTPSGARCTAKIDQHSVWDERHYKFYEQFDYCPKLEASYVLFEISNYVLLVYLVDWTLYYLLFVHL